MKLWLISKTTNKACDPYDSAVVAAETEKEARNISQGLMYIRPLWVDDPKDVTAELIGDAIPGTGSGAICVSFYTD